MIPTGQEDPGNPQAIQSYGCDLLSHWWHVEKVLGTTRFDTPDEIGAEYQILLGNGLTEIDSDCTIEDGELLFSCYGIKVHQVFDPITKSPHISPNYTPSAGQLVILCYHWDAKEYIHFAPGNLDKSLAWDPIVRGSNTIKNGYLHSLRVYNLV